MSDGGLEALRKLLDDGINAKLIIAGTGDYEEKIREKIIVEYIVGKTLYNRVNISPKNSYIYVYENKTNFRIN